MPWGAEPGQANEASRLRLEITCCCQARMGSPGDPETRWPPGPRSRPCPCLTRPAGGTEAARGEGCTVKAAEPWETTGRGTNPRGEHGETPVRKRVTLGRDLQADGRGSGERREGHLR